MMDFSMVVLAFRDCASFVVLATFGNPYSGPQFQVVAIMEMSSIAKTSNFLRRVGAAHFFFKMLFTFVLVCEERIE